MEYGTTTSSAPRIAAGCLIVGVYERGICGAASEAVDEAAGGYLKNLLKNGDLSGRLGRAALLPAPAGIRAKRLLVVGLGKKGEFGVRQYRKAHAAAINAIRDTKIRDVAGCLTLEDIADATPYYLARYGIETIGSTLYRFEEMKSGDRKPPPPIRKIVLAARTRSDANLMKLAATHADAILYGMELTRNLGDLPANVCTPGYLAKTAQKLAKKHARLETRVLSETEMRRLGMHSFLSVTGGTSEPAKLIVMKYKGAAGSKPTVLVGKGITFDAGGISLKPPPGMDEMKFDMCGAAAVMGAMATVAALGLPINLNVVVPTCENLPSGTATRPGDIVKSMSGQTIEILNTDAEGRLILCDALTYARRFKPECVVDVATLTGACVIALGHHLTAIMSNDDALGENLYAAGVGADDRGWRMPMTEDYEEQLKSNFADFANVGGREGGAVTAACFLGKFTKDMRWAHLDIAGTAWRSGNSKGATGRPVPLLAEFLLDRAGVLP